MKDYVVAKRYAEAYLEATKSVMPAERAIQELTDIQMILKDSPDLSKFFSSASITDTEKSDMVEKVFAKNFSEMTRSFLRLLLRKGRFDVMPEIADYARILYERATGAIGLIKSAKPLTEEMITRIRSILENKLHKKIVLNVKTDPALIGGIQVVVGGIVIDGSLQKRLYDLREKLHVLKV